MAPGASSSTATPKANSDFGAGLTTRQPADKFTDEEPSQASRALALGSYFLSGCMAINASQFLSAPLYLINEDWYNAWIAFTKQSWGLLTMTMTQCWAPTVMRVSGHRSVRGQLLQTLDGNLICDFPERLVMIANHQIYTDWLYLWWIGYTAGMHGRIYIVLKESLKKIPILGWGMQFSQFVFLKRNWEKDKPRLSQHLQKFNKASDPMWLMMFPEGTNLADSTRENSKKWAEKHNIDDMQHVLLPRSTGLQFCLQELRKTVDWVYDCTVAYEGVPRGEYAQDIFTLGASYFGGNPPKSVNMYWRRFQISSIPLDDSHAFEHWLRARWTEKDRLMEGYYRTGRFPADVGASKRRDGKILRGAGHIETEIRPTHWYEFLQVFAPIGLVALVLYVFYEALPKRIIKTFNKRAALHDPTQKNQIKLPEKPQLLDSVLKAFGSEMYGLKSAGTTQKLAIDGELIQKILRGGALGQKAGFEAALAKKLITNNGQAQGAVATGSVSEASVTSTAKKQVQRNNAKQQPVHKAASTQPKPKKPPNAVPKKLEGKHEAKSTPKKPDTKPKINSAPKKPEPKKPEAKPAASLGTKRPEAKRAAHPAPKKLNAKPGTEPKPRLPVVKSKTGTVPKKPEKDGANLSNGHAPKRLEIRPKVGVPSKK